LCCVIARFGAFYQAYSQLLLGLSLSAPVCLNVLSFGGNYLAESVSILCLYRLFWPPFILVGIGVSRLAAGVDRAKRLVPYAFLIEGLNLATGVALLIRGAGPNNR
jgi:hypothetical protein